MLLLRDPFRSTGSDSTHLEEVSATLSPALKGCAEAIVRVKVAGGRKVNRKGQRGGADVLKKKLLEEMCFDCVLRIRKDIRLLEVTVMFLRILIIRAH